MMKMKRGIGMKKDKGFTLAELLVVVAIIAIMVAIAMPIFAGRLNNSRNATDAANARAAYAECMAKILFADGSEDGTISVLSDLEVKSSGGDYNTSGWENGVLALQELSIPSIPAEKSKLQLTQNVDGSLTASWVAV